MKWEDQLETTIGRMDNEEKAKDSVIHVNAGGIPSRSELGD